MAESTRTSNLSSNPHWPTDIIGKSEEGVTITDISMWSSTFDQPLIKLVVKFDGNHREPKRYYTLCRDGEEWSCLTPRKPTICSTVISWLNAHSSPTDAPPQSQQ